MEILSAIWEAIQWFHGIRVVLLAVPMILILYFVFGKKSELGRHAIENTSATMVFAAINYIASMIFFKEINEFFQAAYALLHIPTLPHDAWEGLPLLLVSVIGLVIKDFVDYWNHRIMHTRWFWPAHAAHHSDTHVNAFTSYRIHVLESVVMSLSYIVALTWLQMPSAIPIVITLSVVHNMYVHMDLDWDHGRFRYLLASPVYHRWHHADAPEAYGKNLANIIPAWDLLFGTYYVPGVCREPMGALKDGLSDKNPILIFIYPFQEWTRLIRKALARIGARRTAPEETPAEPAVTPAE